MKRKIAILLVICLSAAFFLCSCHIEDKNGPNDISLVSINDEKILNSNTNSQKASILETSGKRVEYRCEKFSGVKTLKKITYTGGIKLEINYSIELSEGNFRAVLIHEDEIVMDLPVGIDQKIVIESPKRSYDIKIAGESASVDIELEYVCYENLNF